MVVLDPQIADRYEVLDKIREGGMGAIYRVRHRLLDEVRVVKVIRAAHPTPEARARFLQEARAATRLRHPNVAVLHDFAVAPDGNALIVLEYIEGWSLLELLREVGPPPLPLTLEIARQALKALGYLHRQSIVHRDISPDNLMLTRDVDGQPLVKLIDLGIAKALAGGTSGKGLTTEGAFLGKPRYAAPEQFSGTGASGPSDLYSFAAVLYELLTGEPPIRGTDLATYMAAHLLQPPLPFEETDPENRVPDDLRAIVLQALAKHPADRPADAASFTRALTDIQVRHPLAPEDFEAVLAVLRPPASAAELRVPGSTSEHIDRRFGNATVAGAPALPADLPLRRDQETRRVARLAPAETLTWRPPAPPEPDHQLEAPRPAVLESEEEAWARWDLRTPEQDASPLVRDSGAETAGAEPGQNAGSLRQEEPPAAAPRVDPDLIAEPPVPALVPFPEPPANRGLRGRTALLTAAVLLLVVAGGAGWQVAGRREAAAVAQATAPAPPETPLARPAASDGRAPALPQAPPPDVFDPGTPAPPPPTDAPRPAAAGEIEVDGSGGPSARRETGDKKPREESETSRREPAGTRTESRATERSRPSSVLTKPASRDREPAVSSRASRTPEPRPSSTRPSSTRSSSSAYRAASRPPRRGDFFLGGRDVSSPVPLAFPRYDYPAAARGCGTASVRVALLIDEHGGIMEANVREGGPPGCGFDQAALAAARRTRFQPAYRGNVPGKMWTELIFDFVEQ